MAWCTDPALSQWTEADRAALVDLAYLHAEMVDGKSALAGEVRLRMDILGLTQKGKRDLRWRVQEQAAEAADRPAASIRRLKAVDKSA